MTSEYKQDYIIVGTVVAIKKYGVFIAINKKRKGFIHISEISEHFVKDINEYINIGDIVHARILSVNDKYKNLTLSLKGTITQSTNIEKDIERRKNKIPLETPNGFLPLKKMLPVWINNSK